jgi:hypothetical protein
MKKLNHEQMIFAIKWCATHISDHIDSTNEAVKLLDHAAETLMACEQAAIEHGRTEVVSFEVALDRSIESCKILEL